MCNVHTGVLVNIVRKLRCVHLSVVTFPKNGTLFMYTHNQNIKNMIHKRIQVKRYLL